MDPELEKRIARVAGDRESGASEILVEALAILREAVTARADVGEVGRALCRAQPSMAPMENAARAALHGHLDRFAERVARAPQAIARFAIDTLETGVPPGEPLRIVTLSYSGTVARVLEALARRRGVEAACSEGRPALEGHRLARRLAAAGIQVTFYTDAAIGHALNAAHAVVVGADAVAPQWFLNKSGTRMLAAAAAGRGVPVYVLAGREKLLPETAAARLQVRSGLAAEVWPDPPPGITVENPYFERTPLELVAAVITDIGALGSADLVSACAASTID